MEEQARSRFELPAAPPTDEDARRDSSRRLVEHRVPHAVGREGFSQKEIEMRVAAELITTDNLGVVPEPFLRR